MSTKHGQNTPFATHYQEKRIPSLTNRAQLSCGHEEEKVQE